MKRVKRALEKMKDKVMGSPSNASPTPFAVYNTRSRRSYLEEEPHTTVEVEEPMEVEPRDMPNYNHIELRLNSDNDLDLMFDDQDLGFFVNFLGVFIFVLVTAYHFVMADQKYEGN
ncbi:hypothetical protein PR202_gn00351 [Eleusine coracana subsp. coracana]|uniref:Transmembrane protein n=1 Tax=Eleusine coracana subsp. coracana TaxID=191504 RepID=A0AAV5G242_ELECO|nr:hypothetical protein PR202_gn00351 [Eleusine coracana subsp. coracana]